MVDRNPFLGWIRSTPAVSDHRPGLSRTHTHKHTYKHTHLPSTFATTPFDGANPVPKQRAEVRRTSGQPASSSGPGQPRSASRVRFLMQPRSASRVRFLMQPRPLEHRSRDLVCVRVCWCVNVCKHTFSRGCVCVAVHMWRASAKLSYSKMLDFDGKSARMGMTSCLITVISPSDTVGHIASYGIPNATMRRFRNRSQNGAERRQPRWRLI